MKSFDDLISDLDAINYTIATAISKGRDYPQAQIRKTCIENELITNYPFQYSQILNELIDSLAERDNRRTENGQQAVFYPAIAECQAKIAQCRANIKRGLYKVQGWKNPDTGWRWIDMAGWDNLSFEKATEVCEGLQFQEKKELYRVTEM